MKKFIYFFLFFLVSLAANSQVQRPAGTASPNSPTGFAVFGYSKSDSGFIWGKRDTFPAKFPTVIWHPNGNFYKTNGNGGAWSIFASSTAGTVSSVSGNAPISVANGTTTPTISADTSYNGLATKKWLYKTVDSLGFIKLNISDTAAMLLTRLKVSDTAYMLSGYLRKADTSTMLSNYVPTFRTIGTNAPLFGGGNLSANRTLGADTGRNAAQLVTGGSLTAVKDSLVALIASSGGGTVLSVATTDGYGVISSVANSTSTPNISLRVDTVSISTRDWRQKGIDSVQNNLTSGLALKLNISDTAAMLSNRFKISDTAFMLMPYMRFSDTSFMLSPYRRTTTKIQNSDLANSTISGISLGSNLAALTFGQYLQVGASSYNGSAATTITTNATSTNSGSTLVARDVNGDFSARNISAALLGNASSASTVAITNDITTNATYYPMFTTVTTGSGSSYVSSSKLTYNPSTGNLSSTGFIGNLTGNASTATVLQTPRTINGVAFDGSANITISAAVGNSLSAGYGITGSPFDGSLARTWVIDTSNISTKANVTGALVGYTATGRFTDSIAAVRALANTKGTGTVTSVATGVGLSGGTITTSGTISADTTTLSTRAYVTGQLVGYATTGNLALKLNISDTATMLSNYRRKTTLIENSDLRNSAITINGSSTALGGSISVGTVTSVAASAGTGISVSGSPITGSGTLTITNTAPDQTVTLTAGTGISVSGTYPNFTVTNTSPSSGGTVTSVTASAPLSSSGGTTPNITISQATTSTNGFLSSTDWNTFNNKQAQLNGTGFVRFSGTTPSYITGTSSQFVKADGSLDGTSYATAASLSGYLPLSGGTLTGALNGTSASFSGAGAFGANTTITGSGRVLGLRRSSAFTGNLYTGYQNESSTEIGIVGYSSTSNNTFSIINGVGDITLQPTSTVNVTGALNGTSLSMSGGATIGARVQVLGNTAPASGTGLELFYDGSGAGTLAFARGTGYIPNFMDGSQLQFFTSSNERGRFASDGTFLINTTTTDGTNKLIVNGGVKVSGANDLTVGRNTFTGGSSSLVTSTGVLSSSANLQVFNGSAASNNVDKIADLLLVNNSSFTDGIIGRVVGINNNLGTSEKRIAQMSYFLNGATNSGSIAFSTMNAGTFGDRLTISSTGAATFSSSVTVQSTTNSTSGTTGALVVGGGIGAGGAIYATSFFETSDKRKKDIFSVTKQSDGIDFIGFTWKKELNLDNKKHLGVIAQQVEKVLPDAVTTDEKGYKSVNYTEVLIYKLEQQNRRIEELEQKLERYSKKAKNKN